MKETVDELAIRNMGMPALKIWSTVRAQYYTSNLNNPAMLVLSEQQVKSRVYRVRNEHFGGELHGIIEVPPFSKVKGDPVLNFSSFIMYQVQMINQVASLGGHIPFLLNACDLIKLLFLLMEHFTVFLKILSSVWWSWYMTKFRSLYSCILYFIKFKKESGVR